MFFKAQSRGYKAAYAEQYCRARKYARRLGDEKGRRQTVAALQRLGYRWDEIRSALREFDALPEADAD